MKVGDLVKWTAEFKSDYAYKSHQGYGAEYGLVLMLWGKERHPRILWNNGEIWGTGKENVEVVSGER